MLETIDARATVRRAPAGVSAWHYRRSASGVTAYTHPEPPPGVSLVAYSRTLAGEHRVRVEANLTTLLYGPEAAAFSLDRDDLRPAISAYLDHCSGLLAGAGLPGAEEWDLHRVDPSATYALPDDVPTCDLIEAAHRAFMGAANSRQTVTLHNSETVTYRQAKWRSWTVYDKAAEIVRKGQTPPRPNMLRLEARIRPRTGSGEWKIMSPNLAAVDDLIAKSQSENLEMLASLATRVGAASDLALVRMLMRGGATLNTALRLATVADLDARFGPAVWKSLGAAERSAQRWRAEIRQYLDASGGEEAALEDLAEVLGHLAPMFAKEYSVTIKRREPSDG